MLNNTSKILIFLTILIFLSGYENIISQNTNLKELKNTIEEDFNDLDGVFALAFIDLSNTKHKIMINAEEKFHAASTMKTPVMIEIFMQAAKGKFSLTDSIIVKNEFKSIVDGSTYSMDIGEDSGEALYKMIGKKVTINDLMYDMITVSSNLATNILIELVDAKLVTNRMRELGAQNIEVLRGVEDIKAFEQGLSNSTTAKDLMIIMEAIATGKAGSENDCQQIVEILKDQKFNDMIPKYLPKNTPVAHKTGSITGVHHDSSIVFLPDGSAYILVILSKKLQNFEKATDEMAKISKKIYDFMMQ